MDWWGKNKGQGVPTLQSRPSQKIRYSNFVIVWIFVDGILVKTKTKIYINPCQKIITETCTLLKYQYLREFAQHVLSQIADIYLKYWNQSKVWIDVKCQTLNLVLQGDEVFKLFNQRIVGSGVIFRTCLNGINTGLLKYLPPPHFIRFFKIWILGKNKIIYFLIKDMKGGKKLVFFEFLFLIFNYCGK